MSFIAPHIKKLKPYIPGKQELTSDYIKLNTNENAYPPPKSLAKKICEIDLNSLREYPDPSCKKIRILLANQFSLKENNITVGNGSDEILNLLFKAFVFSSKTAYFVNPTYSLYKTLAQINNCNYKMLNLEKDFSLPWKKLNKINKGVVIIPNPNAPTGLICENEKLLAYAESKPNVLLVVDEAYNDFGGKSLANKTKDKKNLLVIRTLSKSYSLAGIRMGFAFANTKLISALNKIKDSYNVNILSQKVAELTLSPKLKKRFTANINKINKNKIWTEFRLEKLGFVCINSSANFLFVKPLNSVNIKTNQKISAKTIFSLLLKKKILVRYFPDKRSKDYIRISIGRRSEMEKLIKELKQILKKIGT